MNFYEKIYKIAGKIHLGKVTTYKELAHALNSKAYRAVGTAMNKNPYSCATFVGGKEKSCCSVIRGDSKRISRVFLVACHRVINSDGRVGGFASGTKNKIKMLRKEGVVVISGKVDLKKYFYKIKN